jgi:hypothetical protein
MLALIDELHDSGESWLFELRKRCGQASFASERLTLESLFEDLDTVVEARAQFLKFRSFPRATLSRMGRRRRQYPERSRPASHLASSLSEPAMRRHTSPRCALRVELRQVGRTVIK